MTSKRSLIIHWADQGSIKRDALKAAFHAAGIFPGTRAWREFIDKLFLSLGVLSLAFAVLFFIAYNWDQIGRFAKFGLVQGLIILSVLAYWYLGADKLSAKLTLLGSSILLGVLLALYGQTYQTGADPWQLFFNWALLILPWAVVGRFAAIWVVWVVLANLSITLYYDARFGLFTLWAEPLEQMYWIIIAFNTAVWASWEYLARSFQWLDERWAIRIVALFAGGALTWLAVAVVVGHRDISAAPVLVYLLGLGALYYIYRRRIRDLFMLAAGCLSAIVFVTTFFAKAILEGRHTSDGFLLLALIVLAMGAGSAYWLRNVQREWLQ